MPLLFEGHGGDHALPWYTDFYLTGRRDDAPIEAIVYGDEHVMVDRRRLGTSINRSTDWFRYWLLDSKNPTALDVE